MAVLSCQGETGYTSLHLQLGDPCQAARHTCKRESGCIGLKLWLILITVPREVIYNTQSTHKSCSVHHCSVRVDQDDKHYYLICLTLLASPDPVPPHLKRSLNRSCPICPPVTRNCWCTNREVSVWSTASLSNSFPLMEYK